MVTGGSPILGNLHIGVSQAYDCKLNWCEVQRLDNALKQIGLLDPKMPLNPQQFFFGVVSYFLIKPVGLPPKKFVRKYGSTMVNHWSVGIVVFFGE